MKPMLLGSFQCDLANHVRSEAPIEDSRGFVMVSLRTMRKPAVGKGLMYGATVAVCAAALMATNHLLLQTALMAAAVLLIAVVFVRLQHKIDLHHSLHPAKIGLFEWKPAIIFLLLGPLIGALAVCMMAAYSIEPTPSSVTEYLAVFGFALLFFLFSLPALFPIGLAVSRAVWAFKSYLSSNRSIPLWVITLTTAGLGFLLSAMIPVIFKDWVSSWTTISQMDQWTRALRIGACGGLAMFICSLLAANRNFSPKS
jgi:hypothetical protein